MAKAQDDRVSLTIKLSPADYMMLRDFCTRRTLKQKRRYTHQQAVVDALRRMAAARKPRTAPGASARAE
jgi:hypothetical protein